MTSTTDNARNLETLLKEMRPTLHRYCARMTGSAIDGEDVVQDAMLRAHLAWPSVGPIDNPEGWLFRIAHNAALDLLRRRRRMPELLTEEELAAVPAPDRPDPDIAAASFRTFLRLPAIQRSAVILKDVLGHSIDEVSAVTGMSEAAAKSALQRGRVRLRELAAETEEIAQPVLSDTMRFRLFAYVDSFKAGDFDAVRAMLAEDVKLDLIATLQRQGKSGVGEYYGAYAAAKHWAFSAGVVDGHAAMLVYDRRVTLDQPAYFVALDFVNDQVHNIQDFLYGRYAMEGATIHEIVR
jgi:RNA polymerase sigma-70 factor (ECF subfamily)